MPAYMLNNNWVEIIQYPDHTALLGMCKIRILATNEIIWCFGHDLRTYWIS